MCSSFPARLMEKFQTSKVYLQLATWRTGKFPSRRISRHLWPVWVRPKDKGQNSDLQWGAEGGIETWVWPKGEFIPSGGGEVSGKKTHARYSTHQIPTDTHSYIFPSNTFHLWTYHFFQTTIQQKLAWRTYIVLETDLLGAPDACYGCKKFSLKHVLVFLFIHILKIVYLQHLFFPFLGYFCSF